MVPTLGGIAQMRLLYLVVAAMVLAWILVFAVVF